MRSALICDRRSWSCVAGVYAAADAGTFTGVCDMAVYAYTSIYLSVYLSEWAGQKRPLVDSFPFEVTSKQEFRKRKEGR